MKKLIVVVILTLFLPLFLSADIYVKNVERIKVFGMNKEKQQERVEIKEQWFGINKFAQFGKEHSLIVDNNEKKLYFIMPKNKIYFEFPTDLSKEELLELLPSQIAEAVASVKIAAAKVNPSSETKKIANWNCYSTEFEMVIMIPAINIMPEFKMKIWTTKDLPSDYKKYTKAIDELFERYILGMINIDEDSKRDLAKMEAFDGFQIATEITVNIFGSEINIESQCLEVTEKVSPPGIYSVPLEYTKKTINFLKNKILSLEN